jgi:predicted CoA-binding protein
MDDEGERLSAILNGADTIVVVGASSHPEKDAHAVPARLQRAGWRIVPVNPHADEILGERVYRTLAEVKAAGEPLDLVEVFRPSVQAADMVRQAADVGAKAVWLQEGITSAEGRAIADQAGMDYVEDRCMAVIRGVFALTKPGGS